MRFFELLDQVLGYHPKANILLLEKAYVFTAKVHRGHHPDTNEPYLNHPLSTAGILARMRLDEESIVAGLLHDCLEKKYITSEELEDQFGMDVARIVQGVSRLTQISYASRKERQAEYIRKMILAISQDIRVVLVKLADRLEGMRAAACRKDGSGQSIGQETLDIYAPLAGRLGIDWMKLELEDLAFRCLFSSDYEQIVSGLAKTEEDRRRYVEEVKEIMTARMAEYGLTGRIYGRSKHLYSIYLKMQRQKLDLTRIYDLLAFRVIVDSVKSCYEMLALVHALWEPIEGRFKDYIVKPKSNMYQSLHTSVIGPYRERMEVQIRTEEMDRIANEGIAAHWLYKEGKTGASMDEEETQRFSWLRQLMELSKDWSDPKAFIEAVKVDFYPDEVYVFTPNGDVKAFPRGATPVDFAYEVHTEVGHRCVGARVNGKLVPLRHEMQNGDTVEILTAANHRPSKDWLKQVKSTKAISRIKHWFKTEERERSIALARETCEREFRKKGLNFNNYLNSAELQDAARAFSLRTVDDLLASIGFHKITVNQVIGKLTSQPADEEHHKDEILVEKRKPAPPKKEGVKVKGVDDVLIRMAHCCNPVPGEPILGFITRGRGITAHRMTCKNVDRGDPSRIIEVQWDSGAEQLFPVDIRIVHSGEKGMLAALNGVLGQMDVNVINLQVENQSMSGICRLRIEVRDSRHLQRVISALKNERGVYKVQRGMD